MNYMSIPGLRLINYHSMSKEQCEMVFVREFNKVCKLYGEEPEKVKSNNDFRKREYVEIRQICMASFKKKFKQSYRVAGAFFDKDHATALHALKTVRNLRETDPVFKTRTDPVLRGIDLNPDRVNYDRVK